MPWIDKDGNIKGQDEEILIVAEEYRAFNEKIDIENHNKKEKLKLHLGFDYLFPVLG